MQTCESCTNRIGDGHPYGDITCKINGKYRYMGRKCDTGEYAPIVSDKEIIKQLQAEIESLKCCGNCEWWGVYSENEYGAKIYVCKNTEESTLRNYKCNKWQKL